MKKLLALTILSMAVGLHAQTTPLVVSTPVECATSVDGSVVGTLNPLTPPVLAISYTGTLPAGNYYVQIGYYDASAHVTLASPEVQIQLGATGSVKVSPPLAGMSSTASGMDVYIGATSGSETLQGTTSGGATFNQNVPLVSGSALPAANTTVCSIVANDAGWPTGTGYDVSITTPAGNTLPGYPTKWQLLGPGGTVNVGQGLPYYNGVVAYPVPLLARPYNHAMQSISGPLSMTGYNIVGAARVGAGTNLPGFGFDAQGLGPNGAINAQNGYTYNGAAPYNHTLVGNGSYYLDSPISWAMLGANQFTPVISPGAALGAGGTATLQTGSNDFSGVVFLNTGSSPLGTGTLFTLTFGGTYASTIRCQFMQQNGGGNIPTWVQQLPLAAEGSTAITIANFAGTAPPASTTNAAILYYDCHP